MPAITAFKETSGDARRIAELMTLCPAIDVMVGGGDWALEVCAPERWAGSPGSVDVLPAQSVRLWERCLAGDLPTARDLYAEARLDMTPKLVQYFKAALDELGLGGGPCRPPRLPLTEAELPVLRRAVERFLPARLSP